MTDKKTATGNKPPLAGDVSFYDPVETLAQQRQAKAEAVLRNLDLTED